MPPLKISIVTPSLNQARFLDASIQSVMAQQYPDVEHIVVDGGSTDETLEILKRYPHLRWISEKDRGQTDALNKGFRMATGEIIGWLNSDDTYCQNIFPMVAEHFNDPRTMVLCGDGFEIDEQSRMTHPMSSSRSSSEDLIRYWKWQYEFVQPAFFFRRNVFNKVGYLDETLYYAMDYDLFIRLGLKYQFKYIPIPLANLRMYPESKSGRNVQKFIPGYIREMHNVSKRFWGTPVQMKYYRYLFSFVSAVLFSFLKNISFSPTSKSRAAMNHFFWARHGS